MRSLSVPEWCCAIRFNNGSASIFTDRQTPFTVIKDSYRYWTADPFLFKKDNEYYLFFEQFDRLKRKGLIGYRRISENSIGKMKVIYECDSHLSYPFIYEDGSGIYIIPESNRSGELFRLKCVEFPDKWEKEKVIFEGRLADTTIYTAGDNVFYFSERVDDSNTFDRLDMFYESNGELKEFDNNPVKKDATTARCAGKLFENGDMLIRPSQDCGQAYGDKLNFNKVVSLDINKYEEELITTVKASEIKTSDKCKYIGIHTYNKLDNIEIVDLKKRNFNILNVLGAILKRI